MYQVGFGDCFMVSFEYGQPLADGRSERHMLVDFGSTHRPEGSSGSVVERAAQRIAEHTGGRLDVVVVTHRHRDHLSGFGDKEAGAVIEALKPTLVVRPWTEHPDLPHDATAPADPGSGAGFTVRLAAGQALAGRVAELTEGASARSRRGELRRLALDQLPNRRAIEFLDRLAGDGGSYLSAGMPSGIEQLIPGIRVRVLGPPTIEQSSAILKQRSSDPDEFWLAQTEALAGLDPRQLEPTPVSVPPGTVPGPVAWLVERMARQQVGSLMRVVRTVDDALNNTSLILLVDVGDRRLLLPGDAQIENWSWPLFGDDAERNRALLAGVDLYKVGHHGSRNATPKSLFRLWEEAGDPRRPMTALLSTMPDVHGESEATAVPRTTLTTALERRMRLVRTDDLEEGQDFVAVAAASAGDASFEPVDPADSA
jgi:hypothetical protein